jgi:hypothetical protein
MKEGQTVRYLGCTAEQIRWGRNKDPRPILITKALYTLEKVEVHGWHTKIWLKHFGGPYNSVCFEEV